MIFLGGDAGETQLWTEPVCGSALAEGERSGCGIILSGFQPMESVSFLRNTPRPKLRGRCFLSLETTGLQDPAQLRW